MTSCHPTSENIKVKARHIWEEIFPQGDADALAEVIHFDSFDHTDPSGPQGFEAVKNTMLWLNCVLPSRMSGLLAIDFSVICGTRWYTKPLHIVAYRTVR